MDSLRVGRADGRARVLIVSTDLPGPLDRGFRIRVHHLAASLTTGHDVTLLAPACKPTDAGPLSEFGVEVLAYRVGSSSGPIARVRHMLHRLKGGSSPTAVHRAAVAALKRSAQERRFDVVQVESPDLVLSARALGVPVVLDAHNIWHELARRRAVMLTSRRRRVVQALVVRRQRTRERRAWRQADLCLTTSAREKVVLAAAGASRPTVVPNGVDTDLLLPCDRHHVRTVHGSPYLVLVGLMAYGPNADAAQHLIRDVLPLVQREHANVGVRIVGGDPPPALRRLADTSVDITGYVPDVEPHICGAAVVVVPLRVGSGTRLKVLEALALGRPVVTTSLGAEGIDVVDGTHVLVADGARAFADAVLRLLADPLLAAALGSRGRRLVEDKYAWARVGDRLAHAYSDLLTQP